MPASAGMGIDTRTPVPYIEYMASTMNAAQTKALESLRSQQAAGWPKRITVVNHGTYIVTGVNTTILHNLRRQGLITVGWIYLGGKVTTDITVKE